ncbi:crotonase/enoyl-CoA hydratase family protein [Glaciecola petra]|uniref:Crotonase/enoyl-CoA hydratase family protein n=1 Tax=Glaciecola petra TaxID=3075602 RepID=A0ABU2ZPW4_9ALTE|nr:crotonase/enoyl-CoA hydratase family protein [Aestuariibacter sp. P117]MDT0594657.1 crotonase/enoyl-CoA hydratase family protein [Aestuariibacter sp. P117]
MTNTVSYSLDNNVATITMDDGKANALSSDTIANLNAAFDMAEADDAIVILTGRDGVFSGGFNLKEMQKGQAEALLLTSKGSKLARRILAFPKPVIALATGHSIAMGAFLLLACDYRMIAQGDFKVGLNETLIGMTMHNFGIELARYRLAKNYFNRCVINAEIFDPQGAVDAGFIDRIVPQEQMPMAAAMAGKMFAQLDMTAFRNTKMRSRIEAFAILDKAIEDDLDPSKVHAV